MKRNRLNSELKKLDSENLQHQEYAKRLIGAFILAVVGPLLRSKADSLHEFQEAYAIGIRNLLSARNYPVCVMDARNPEGYVWKTHLNALHKFRTSRNTRKDRNESYEAYLLRKERERLATTSSSTPIGNKEFMRLLTKALSKIPKRQSEAFRLRHINGNSVAEVAGIMDITVNTAKEYLKNSKKSLRKVLPSKGDIDNDYLE